MRTSTRGSAAARGKAPILDNPPGACAFPANSMTNRGTGTGSTMADTKAKSKSKTAAAQAATGDSGAPLHRQQRFEIILEWFDRYLK